MNWLPIVIAQALVTILVAWALYRCIRPKLQSLDARIRELRRAAEQTPQERKAIDERMTSASGDPAQISRGAIRDEQRLRIVVNTLPKVGSTSIVATLKQALPEAIVDQFHGISLDSQRVMRRVIEQEKSEYIRTAGLAHLFRVMEVRPELERRRVDGLGDTGVTFVSAVREPVAWALSLAFQDYELDGISCADIQPGIVTQTIMDWMHGSPKRLFYLKPEDWFRREFHEYLGINLLEAGFDIRRGFQVYDAQRGRLLMIRQESLERLPEALAEVFAAPQSLFQSAHANVTERKSKGAEYRETADAIRFPIAFLEELYSRPCHRLFYGPDERSELIAKWSA